jgi:hypothetical protein
MGKKNRHAKTLEDKKRLHLDKMVAYWSADFRLASSLLYY